MITNELLNDPNKEVTTIEVYLRLSTLKPIHRNVVPDHRVLQNK